MAQRRFGSANTTGRKLDVIGEYLSMYQKALSHTYFQTLYIAYRITELKRCRAAVRFISFEPLIGSVGKINLSNIHWAIVGGESGPKSRFLDINWVDQIFDQCEKYDVQFFFKQWGGVNKKRTGRTFRGRTWNEMPNLRVYA